MVRRIKATTGVHSIHLSCQGSAQRTVAISGPMDALLSAYDEVAALLRSEAGVSDDAVDPMQLIVPDAINIVGDAAMSKMREAFGVAISVSRECEHVGPKQVLLVLKGTALATRRAAHSIVKLTSTRHENRHRDFFAQWPSFETHYNDHFETPTQAFADVAPLLQQLALSLHGGGRGGDALQRALQRLTVYDPYYCKGAMRESLAKGTGCSAERIVNENRDFYVDVASGQLPPHDCLVTNPPYSGEHKQKLLQYLLDQGNDRPMRPFLLLMPAWLALSDYWRDFLGGLASRREESSTELGKPGKPKGLRKRRRLERRAGVFYVCPRARYNYVHPDGTGHARSPFHSVWYVGGFPSESKRRRVQRSLRAARHKGDIEVFRAARMLHKRGHCAKGGSVHVELDGSAAESRARSVHAGTRH